MATLFAAVRTLIARRPSPGVQSGQIFVLFTIMILMVLGILAIAVDVGLAYRQRQNQQNMASNAAEAGAYQLYGFKVFGTPIGGATAADAQVLSAMRGCCRPRASPPYNSRSRTATMPARGRPPGSPRPIRKMKSI